MTATDPRLAPLAAALHDAILREYPGAHGPRAIEWRYLTDAERAYESAPVAAALAALDGWTLVPNDETKFHRDMSHSLATFADEQAATIATLRDELEHSEAFNEQHRTAEREQAATIATLRAELDGLVEAVEIAIGYIDQRRSEAMPIWYQDFDALRAALAAAKETTDDRD
jgi:hypothetical protein